MRPRTEVPPTLSVGASLSGVLKDALISMRLSLIVGSRWRTLPASHRLAGAAAVEACAIRSAGKDGRSETAAEARRKCRRSIVRMGASAICLWSNDRLVAQGA